MYVEKVDCSCPSQLRRRFVIARRGVVMEAMIGLFVDISGVSHFVSLQRFFIRRPAAVNARVEFSVLEQ